MREATSSEFIRSKFLWVGPHVLKDILTQSICIKYILMAHGIIITGPYKVYLSTYPSIQGNEYYPKKVWIFINSLTILCVTFCFLFSTEITLTLSWSYIIIIVVIIITITILSLKSYFHTIVHSVILYSIVSNSYQLQARNSDTLEVFSLINTALLVVWGIIWRLDRGWMIYFESVDSCSWQGRTGKFISLHVDFFVSGLQGSWTSPWHNA